MLRRPRRSRTAAALAAATVGLGGAWPGRALAAPSVALDRVEAPSPGGPHLLTPSAGPTAGEGAASVLVEHAWRPLVLIDPATGDDLGVLVSGQTVLHLGLGLAPLAWMGLDVALPVALAQAGDGAAPGFALQQPGDAAPGDVRLGLRLRAASAQGAAPGLSLGLRAWLPTGTADSYLGAGTTRLAPTLDLGGALGGVGWGLSLQRRSAPWLAGRPLVPPHEWLLTAAVTVPLTPALGVGPELLASTQEGGGRGAFAAQGTGLELLGTARLAVGPLWAAAGAGAGLTAGVGTPAARVLFQVGAAIDTGIAPLPDETPTAAPAATSGARPVEAPVEADADGDTVPDATDACRDQAGDASPTAPRRGCPTLTAAEACAAGATAATCPAAATAVDTDGDGFPDAADACPAEAGVADPDPRLQGCPRSVRVEAGQIVITEQVQFATGSDRIEPQSFAILGQVAAALAAHPELARIAVDGHTDDAGVPLANLELSRRRAMAVLRWLTEHGVDERRLEARGFGQRQPLVRERTPEARARNRRVEFQILERTTRGAAGWHDGPVEREAAP